MSLLVDIWIYSLILFLRAWKGENYNKGFVWVKIPSFLQTFSFLSDYSRFSYILPKVFILSRLRTLRAQACSASRKHLNWPTCQFLLVHRFLSPCRKRWQAPLCSGLTETYHFAVAGMRVSFSTALFQGGFVFLSEPQQQGNRVVMVPSWIFIQKPSEEEHRLS